MKRYVAGKQVARVDQDDRRATATARVTMCSDTAACAPKLDDSACSPGRFATAQRTRSSALMRSRSLLTSSMHGRLVHCPARIPGERSHTCDTSATHAARAPTRPARQAKSPKPSPSMRSLA